MTLESIINEIEELNAVIGSLKAIIERKEDVLHTLLLRSELPLSNKFDIWKEYCNKRNLGLDAVAGYPWIVEACQYGEEFPITYGFLVSYAKSSFTHNFELDLIELNLNAIVDTEQ